jgi:hypothetical protein
MYLLFDFEMHFKKLRSQKSENNQKHLLENEAKILQYF